jgi:hypothetical protein
VKVPKRYLSKNPNVMKREIKKHAEKKDSDSSAYKEWDADYKSKKAGKGKPVKTNVSKYTKKYKEMYGESESESQLKTIMDYESFSNSLNEGSRKGSVDTKGSPADKSLGPNWPADMKYHRVLHGMVVGLAPSFYNNMRKKRNIFLNLPDFDVVF